MAKEPPMNFYSCYLLQKYIIFLFHYQNIEKNNLNCLPGLGKELRPMQTCCGFNPIQNSHQHPRELKAQGRRPSRAVTTLPGPIPRALAMMPPQQMDLQAWGHWLELHWPSQTPPLCEKLPAMAAPASKGGYSWCKCVFSVASLTPL